MTWRSTASVATAAALGATIAISTAPIGCNSSGDAPEITRTVIEPPDLPRFMRGSIRYEAELSGYGSAIATGYGIVVGLNGTGSSDIPVSVRAMLEREAAAMVEQTRITDNDQFRVADILNSRDTAVVLVEAIVPPGAAEGTRFDVAVTALPATSTTSLEGGRLWTTRLMQGITLPSSPSTTPIAMARGDLYINPFAASNREESVGFSGVNPRTARILNGGVMTRSMPLVLNLRTPSYSRSRAIADAINSRFPQEPGQPDVTGRPISGSADERINITVPPSWRERSDEFVEVLMATPIRQGGAEQRAYQLTRWLKDNPIDAQPVSWCLVALGELALPTIQQLYEYPESIVRLAGLKAGAKLGDPAAAIHLGEIALDRESPHRLPAIELLEELPSAARVNMTLRRLLDDPNRDVRVAAFEGLRHRQDLIVQRLPVGESGAFELYAVPSEHPMVYATQQGAPRITIFGKGIELTDPAIVDLWSSQLIIVTDEDSDEVRIRHQHPRTGEVSTYERNRDVIDFIRFLGDDGRGFGSEGGLALDYSRTVGALYALSQEDALGAPLIAERDLWLQRYTEALRQDQPMERPIGERPDVEALRESMGSTEMPQEAEPTADEGEQAPPPNRPVSDGP